MSDVLAGMTRKEAEALVARCEAVQHDAIEWEDGSVTSAVKVICEAPEDVDALLALAALGARCVGGEDAWAFIPPSGLAGGNYLGEMYRSPNGSLLPQANDNPAWARRVIVLEGE